MARQTLNDSGNEMRYWAAPSCARQGAIEVTRLWHRSTTTKQTAGNDGWSSVVRGLGPVHQRNFLGANPCAPKTPILCRKRQSENNDMRFIEEAIEPLRKPAASVGAEINSDIAPWRLSIPVSGKPWRAIGVNDRRKESQ